MIRTQLVEPLGLDGMYIGAPGPIGSSSSTQTISRRLHPIRNTTEYGSMVLMTVPIPATSKPHHLDDNMGAGAGPALDEAARAKLIAILEG